MSRYVVRRVGAITVGLSAVLALAPVATDANAAPVPSASASPEQVLVLFKHQFGDKPATRGGLALRRSAIVGDQTRVSQLLTASKAHDVRSYSVINAMSATVTPSEAAALGADPSVAQVVRNEPVASSPPPGPKGSATTATPGGSIANACPGPNDAPFIPEPLQLMNVDSNNPQAPTARSLGYDGSDVKVGIIADGIDPTNPEFVRQDGSPVIVDYEDFTGVGLNVPTNGAEAFLDASSVAAQGRNVYDVSHFSAHAWPGPCRIRIEGVAPGASLVMLDPFGPNPGAFLIPWVQAIDYAVSVAHVDVLNESLGGDYFPGDLAQDAVVAANDAAVAAGVTVTSSTGDWGPANTIDLTTSDPNIISVGATTAFRDAVQTGVHGAVLGATGWLSNNIAGFSSSGFTQQGRTLDVVAPGDESWVACTPDLSRFQGCFDDLGQPSDVRYGNGTSESAPLTAGVAALVIQAYARAHGGTKPTPAVVKQLITSTADDVGAPAEQQGAGLVDAYRAVRAAMAAGATLLESRSQFNSVSPGGTNNTFTEQLTNASNTPVTVDATSRTLGSYRMIKTARVDLKDGTSPTYIDGFGFTENYEQIPFTVPTGVDRLDTAIAYTANPALAFDPTDNAPGAVAIVLLDPLGRLAAFSFTVSAGNHSDSQVTNPMPGHWTAFVVNYQLAGGGTNGPVLFAASVAHDQPFGSVSPAHVTVPANSTRPVTLTVRTPVTTGDSAGSLVLSTAGGPAQTVPVTLRSLARLGLPALGVVTGGNGVRGGAGGQTAFYQLDVPRGEPSLTANITLGGDPGDQFFAFLVDPNGQVEASQSNGVLVPINGGGAEYSNDLGATLRVLNPAADRWTLIIDFTPQVSGKELAEPFTVQFTNLRPIVTQQGLPRGGQLSSSTTKVANVSITNTGSAPVAYYLDARLSTQATYDMPILGAGGPYILFAVPNLSTSVTMSARSLDGVTPVQVDLGPQVGDPYVVSAPSVTPGVTVTGNPVTPGTWVSSVFNVGPYPQPPPPTFVSPRPLVTTAAFDPAVSSPTTGDPWLWTLNPAVGSPFSPVIAQPGQTVTIPVDITPNAPVGTSVTGTLYLDEENDINTVGGFGVDANVDAALPYTYTVGP